MSDATHYVVATAGHVDHGKSALIKALTGTDPDRLPEEKARGMTIDLGFAHLELPSPTAPSFLHVGIVDVPGHEDFVKNMVAGVGSVDLALLVVAADDGWMPQTEEHLQILMYVGVRRAVVSLTKADLAEDEAGKVSDVRRRLQDSAFAEAPIVPTSVLTGRGLDTLKATLAKELSEASLSRDIGKPRLAVDRVFTLPGTGTVVTGTLAGGTLQRGQSVVIQPSGHHARIRRIQSHGRDVDASGPGTRTALNLADVNAAEGIHRGDVITLPDMGGSSDCLDVMLEISPRASRSAEGWRARPRALRQRERASPRGARLGEGTAGRRPRTCAAATGGPSLLVRRRPPDRARLVRAADAGRGCRARSRRAAEGISQQRATDVAGACRSITRRSRSIRGGARGSRHRRYARLAPS